MRRVTISIILAIMTVIMPFNALGADGTQDEIYAKSSILMCMDTREVISQNNAYEHLSPASVTKLMSILLILEAIDTKQISLDDMVTATENAQSKGGSQIWLEVGEQMSVNDLFKAVVISSANDACTLLGEYIAGSDSAFVDMMNNKVKELGLENSHFENCTGLDDEVSNHYSCAYDLAIIACEIMKYDLITEYSTVWLDYLRNGETELNNTNKLINKYSGMTGLKTGTTSIAGFCLCATASRDNMSLVSVVLGAENSDDRFDLTEQLLDYGFNNYKVLEIEIDANKISAVNVKGGVTKQIKPTVDGESKVLINKSADELTYKYNIKKEVSAPIKKGDILGEISVYNGDKKISSVALVSDNDIKTVTFTYIFKKLLVNI